MHDITPLFKVVFGGGKKEHDNLFFLVKENVVFKGKLDIYRKEFKKGLNQNNKKRLNIPI